MAPANVCSVCRGPLPKREFLTCFSCKLTYDIDCANVSPKRFALMEPRHKSTWKCKDCYAKQPKAGDSTPKTPIANLNNVSPSDGQGQSNVTIRAKSALPPPHSQSPPCYVTEDSLRQILKLELSAAITSTIKELVTTELKNLNEKITSYHDSMMFLNQQYEDLNAHLQETSAVVTELKKDNERLKATVSDLTGRLNTVELHMRECNVEINGVPENRSENLIDTMVQLTKAVENPLTPDDIQHVTRVAKLNRDNDKPRAIVAKLRNPRIRDQVLAAVTKFNKKYSQDKLSTRHLGIGGTRSPVFVSEHLTPGNKHLHAAARKKAKEMSYKFVWVRNGRVYVRKDETHQALSVRSLDSLNLIR